MKDIFEAMEDITNIVVEPEKGIIVLILKTYKKNKVIEIPSEIPLMVVKKDGVKGEIIDELKKLREEMELLK